MTAIEILRSHTLGRLRHLELNRPEKRNALSRALRTELVNALETAASDDDVGAVLLSSTSETFCAGFDLSELADAPDPATVFADSGHYHNAVYTFPKPLIAAIPGAAVAGGLDLALMCDIRLASETATFGQPQVRRGIPAAYELMAHVLGVAAARDLCLSGRVIDAHEASALGLVSLVTSPGDLPARAVDVARTIADGPGGQRAKQQFIAHQPRLFADTGNGHPAP